MSGTCSHTSLVSVPSEDDPEHMALVCLSCNEIVDTFRVSEGLAEEGASLGDPYSE